MYKKLILIFKTNIQQKLGECLIDTSGQSSQLSKVDSLKQIAIEHSKTVKFPQSGFYIIHDIPLGEIIPGKQHNVYWRKNIRELLPNWKQVIQGGRHKWIPINPNQLTLSNRCVICSKVITHDGKYCDGCFPEEL